MHMEVEARAWMFSLSALACIIHVYIEEMENALLTQTVEQISIKLWRFKASVTTG